MQIKIGQKTIGEGKPALIIAEAGVNHNGALSMAKKLIKAAKEAGADVIKFQTFITEEVVTQKAPLVAYQESSRAGGSTTQFEMLKSLELDQKAHRELQSYARRMGILFLSTPDDIHSARLLASLRVPAFKIGSSDLTNIPFLTQVASYKKPILLSTGMSTLQEVRDAVSAIHRTEKVPLVLLHTSTRYPCPLDEVNMRALVAMRQACKVPVGYSDHTAGVSAAMAAVSLGACVIEKHLTLDRRLPGPDHKASYEPDEFKVFVQLIREVESCLGNGRKEPTAQEKKDIPYIRKSVIARVDIPKGTIVRQDHLAIKRPQGGALPQELPLLVGKRAVRAIRKDMPIRRKDVR